MLDAHGDWVQKETLAVSLEAVSAECETPGDGFRESLKVNGLAVTIEVKKA
jgi:hypothetical protein